MDVRDSRVHNYPPRWNAAPSQDLLVIRRNHQTGQISLDPLRWGLLPYWCGDPKGGRKPINAKCETVRTLPTFRDAYQRRRCIVPVDGFLEWMAARWAWWAVGELERPDLRRVDPHVCDHHD
jgi:putative SOS response-associated peptidase YedK